MKSNGVKGSYDRSNNHWGMSNKEAVIMVGRLMELAARTAPKAMGKDFIETVLLTDEQKVKLGEDMIAVGKERGILVTRGTGRTCWTRTRSSWWDCCRTSAWGWTVGPVGVSGWRGVQPPVGEQGLPGTELCPEVIGPGHSAGLGGQGGLRPQCGQPHHVPHRRLRHSPRVLALQHLPRHTAVGHWQEHLLRSGR